MPCAGVEVSSKLTASACCNPALLRSNGNCDAARCASWRIPARGASKLRAVFKPFNRFQNCDSMGSSESSRSQYDPRQTSACSPCNCWIACGRGLGLVVKESFQTSARRNQVEAAPTTGSRKRTPRRQLVRRAEVQRVNYRGVAPRES